MATTNSRPLMRRKVNVNETLIQYWKKLMGIELRHLIHAPLLEMEDYGLAFKHQDRTFEIFGMTENGHMMLREMVDGEPNYWECTRHFVQMKLDRRYVKWETIAGMSTTIPMDYDTNKLLLPPQRATRRKAVAEEEEIEKPEFELIEYTETDYSSETED
jgi:hypothetical protein